MDYTIKDGGGGFLVRYDKDGCYAGSFDSNGNNYHRDWNLLIPVVKKLQDIGLKNEVVFHSLDKIYDALLNLEIDLVWKEVITVLSHVEDEVDRS